jgi:autotransporter-associated beta strand protein
LTSLTSGVNGGNTGGTEVGRPTDVANTNAGPNFDGTFGAYALGWCFLDGTSRLVYTPEYNINPINYVPGSIVFTWYQGNAATGQGFQVVVQQGGTWYASTTVFDNTPVANAGAFGTGAELKTYTYDPAAANWVILNFNGSYNFTNQSSTASSAISLGSTPGASLSGTITAFGLYRNATGSNGRFDSYQIDATPAPVGTGKNVTWTGNIDANWDVVTTNWTTSGVATNYSDGDIPLFDDTALVTNVNITAAFSPGGVTVSNNTVNYVFAGVGGIAGTNGLTKRGSGTLVLDTANSYSGVTTIGGGTLAIGDGGGSGSLGTGIVTNNGSLVINVTNNVTVANAISGSGSLTQNGSAILTLSGASTYTGQTTVNAGSLVLNGILGGGGLLTNAAGTTLSGRGTNTGLVWVSGQLLPGTSAGTFTAGGLTLDAGATLVYDANTNNTVGGGVNDLIQVNGNLTLNNNSVSINLLGAPQTGVPYRIVNYTGTRSGAFNASVSIIGGSHFAAALSYDDGAKQVNVTFSGSAANLIWNELGGAEWDLGVTPNWTNLASASADVFHHFDNVLFDDTAGVNASVTLNTNVSPSSVTNDSSVNTFTISGTGKIGGAARIVKRGASTLTLNTANDNSGGLNVEDGAVRLTTLTAAGTGTITVSGNGAAVAGSAHTNRITLAGGSVGGVNAIASLSGDLTATTGTTSTIYMTDPQNNTLNSEMNFTGTLHGGGNLIVVSGSNDATVDSGVGFRLRGTAASDFSGTITLSNNVKGELQTTVAGPFSPAGTGKIVVVCGLYDGNGTATAPVSGGFSELNIRNNFTNHSYLGNNVEVIGAGLATLNPLGSAPSNAVSTMGNLKIGDGQELGVIRNSGQPQTVLFQSVTLTGGNARFSPRTPGFGAATASGSDLTLSNITQLVPGSGITMAGLRTLTLNGSNSYSGNTYISSGTLALVNNASISNSPLIHVAAGATVSVAGRTDTKLTLASGQSLQGDGTVNPNLVVTANSSIAPGSNSIGVLTILGTLTLQGTAYVEIDKSLGPSSDQIVGTVGGTIICGGKLSVTNVNPGMPLADGDAFSLFTGFGTFSGGPFTIVPASPGGGLAWDTSTLTTDGTLRVVAGANSARTNIIAQVVGNQLDLSWPADHTGWRLQVQTNSISVGLRTNWVDVPGATTTNHVVVPINPANGAVFYRMAYP